MGATAIFAALAAVAAAAFFVGLMRARALAARVSVLEADAKRSSDELRAAIEKEKKGAKLLEQRTEELTEMKKEHGAIKKKLFAREEEWKKKTGSLSSKLEEREKELGAKPAFADPEPQPAAKPKVEVRPEPAPVKVVLAPNPELEQRAEALERDKAMLAAQLTEARAELRNLESDMRRARRRVENYRRIDAVHKNKLELLADKLSHTGRAYYDAISELAALKGEVGPRATGMADDARAHAEAVQADLARDTIDDEPQPESAATP